MKITAQFRSRLSLHRLLPPARAVIRPVLLCVAVALAGLAESCTTSEVGRGVPADLSAEALAKEEPQLTRTSSQSPLTLSGGWQLQDIAKVPEPGEIVSTAAYTPAGWFKATVPGTVLTTLVNNGVYP